MHAGLSGILNHNEQSTSGLGSVCVFVYIQGVPEGKDLTPGGRSLCQTIPI